MEEHTETQARWVDGLRGKGKVLLDQKGFRMRYKKEVKGKKFFVCALKDDLHCAVAVTLNVEKNLIIRSVGEHNHDNDLVKEAVKNIISHKIKAAVETRDSPRAVLMDITNSLLADQSTSAGVPYLPEMNSFARQLNRKKQDKLGAPPIPTSWAEMEMPDIFKTTSDNLPFVVMDQAVLGTDKKIWGFSSPTGLTVMNNATDLYVDGTFEFVDQTLFQQLYVVVAKLENDVSIPTAFYMLPAKDFATYRMVFENMKEKGVVPPHNFHLDFEAASIKAITTVYPQSNIVACDTHWKRALRTNLQKVGLLSDYNQDYELQTFVRKLWSLTLVPLNDVVSVWEEVEATVPVKEVEDEDDGEEGGVAQEFNNKMQQFLLYFEQTWIGAKNPRTQLRARPKFAHKTWNKYTQALNGEDMTNNISEAWNSVSKMKERKCSIWTVLAAIKKEEALARAKFHRAARGEIQTGHKGRIKKREERKEQLKKVLAKYGTVTTGEYVNLTATFHNQ